MTKKQIKPHIKKNLFLSFTTSYKIELQVPTLFSCLFHNEIYTKVRAPT